jgi:hypothetical protein
MRGYFSQLARSTGIRIAPARTHAAAPHAESRAEPRAAVTAAPPHVEEVTFVEQPPDPRRADGRAEESEAAGDRTRRVSDAGRARPDSQHSAEAARRDASAVSADSAASPLDAELPRGESPAGSPAPRPDDAADEHLDALDAGDTPRTSARATAESPTPRPERRTPDSRAEQSRAVEIREGFPSESEGELTARADAPGEQERVSNQGTRLDARRAARRGEEPDASDEPAAAELAATIDDERGARVGLVRQYLREVRAWVEASPEPEDVLPEWAGEAEESPPGRRAGESRAAEASVSLEPPPARAPEVQDVSLSIGSISIVVEGTQQQQIPVTPPPQQQAPAGAHGAPAAPVDLSRYYIRRF